MTLRVANAQGWNEAGLVEGEEGVVGGFDEGYVQDRESEKVRLCSGSGFIVETSCCGDVFLMEMTNWLLST